MSKPSVRVNEQLSRNLRDVGAIPTDNADEALEFCRSLVRQIDSHGTRSGEFPTDAADNNTHPMMASATEPEISIVIPVFNEEENLPVLCARLLAALDAANLDFEIVFVDDGSRDQSRQKLTELEATDKRIIVIELARNFGHQVAITAGLDFARGKAVVVMDGDLQDPPEVLPQFIAKWRQGYEVVYAIRERRKESWLMRCCYATFYRLLRRVANIDIPLDAGDFCIMDRRVVDLLKAMPERNRFIRGIRSWVGFRQVGLPFERQARHAGASKYTVGRLTLLALDGLISFSYIPLRVITMLGLSVSLLSLIMAVFFFVKKLIYGLSPPGFAAIITSIFFLAGIQLITLGVIGEYVGRIFEEAKRRPIYTLRRVSRDR